MSSNKRRRTGSIVVPMARPTRPIDKSIIAVALTATSSIATSTLQTTTFPCTVVGLRWSLSILCAVTTTNPIVAWAIVVVKDGNSANSISISNAADFYTPEQNVLAFGMSRVSDSDSGSGPKILQIDNSTKTMRKLKAGDLLQFICISDTASGANINGAVQFFCKS